LLIGNQYYCLCRTVLSGTNITVHIGQSYCLIPPILLPNLEPSYCIIKKMKKMKDIHDCSIAVNKVKLQLQYLNTSKAGQVKWHEQKHIDLKFYPPAKSKQAMTSQWNQQLIHYNMEDLPCSWHLKPCWIAECWVAYLPKLMTDVATVAAAKQLLPLLCRPNPEEVMSSCYPYRHEAERGNYGKCRQFQSSKIISRRICLSNKSTSPN
jgi:hypothetical protein